MTRVLIDTSVWIAHFRRADPTLQAFLMLDQALCHPLIVLELACGTPPAPRARSLGDLRALQQGVVATNDEVLALIERERLYESGCGAIDMGLLASALLTPGATLWTLDKKLETLAVRLGVAYRPAAH